MKYSTIALSLLLAASIVQAKVLPSFAQLDTNQDGQISPAEMPDLDLDLLDHADGNSDGQLTAKELKGYRHYQKRIAEDNESISEGTKIFKDIQYVKNGDRRHKLDLYYPADHDGKEVLPLIVYIHGGGWQKGSKNSFGKQAFLVEQGYAVASINYRLSQQAKFPAQLHDVKAAVRFLRANADRYAFDSERFGLWGTSAGGHLAGLLATTADDSAMEGNLGVTDASSKVQAVCMWFAPTDILKMQKPYYDSPLKIEDPLQFPLPKLLGGLINDNIELAISASPIAHVTPDDTPALIMHGGDDKLVPVSQSTSFHEKLLAVGVESELVIVDGHAHSPFEGSDQKNQVVAFFNKHFQATIPSTPTHAFNQQYKSEELGTILSYIDCGTGLGAVTYHRGLVIAPMSFDFGGGLGDGAVVAYNVNDPRDPLSVFDSRDYPKRFHDEGSQHYLGDIAEVHGMHFHGDKVLLADRGFNHAGFIILDLGPLYDSDPNTLPAVVCRYKFPEVERTTVYDGFSFAPTWVGGRYAYTPTGSNGLYIVDTQDFENPKLLAHMPKSQLYNQTLRAAQSYGDLLVLTPAAIASVDADMVLVDVSNPAYPSLINRHTIRIGYLGTLYGSLYYNGAFAADRGNAKTSEIIAYDIADPMNVKTIEIGTTDKLIKPEYLYVKDDDLFIGHYPGLSRWEWNQDGEFNHKVNIEPQFPAGDDYAFVSPLGNLTIVTSDHIVESRINLGVNQIQPDRKAPEVKYVLPKQGQMNVSQTSSIGISFSDFIDNHCLQNGAVILRERGSGKSVDCTVSHGIGIVTAVPTAPLKINTTYDVILTPKLTDMMGNAYEGDELVTSFSTGHTLANYACTIVPDAPKEVGSEITLTATINNEELKEGITYSWNFGDESADTAFSKDPSISKTVSKPGNFNITLTTKQVGSDKLIKSSAVQVVHAKLPNTRPVSSSTILLDESSGTLFVVNPDNNTLTAIHTATGETRYEVATAAKPVSIARSGNQLWITSLPEDLIAVHDLESGAHQRNIALGYGRAPVGIVINEADSVAYVTLSAIGQVQEVDLQSGQLKRNIQLEGPLRNLSFIPERNLLVAPQFIASEQKGSIVQWVDTNNWTVTHSERLTPSLNQDGLNNGRGYPNFMGPIAVNPEQNNLWIPGKKDNLFRGLTRDKLPLTFDHTVRSIAVSIDLDKAAENEDIRIDLDNSDFASAAAYNPFGNIVYFTTMGSQTIWAVDAYDSDNQSVFSSYGEGPSAIISNSTATRLYVHNQLSRTIAVFDSTPGGELQFHARWNTVANEQLSDEVLFGKQLFHNTTRGSMAQEGYMSCASCHFDGSHDGRIWDISNLGEGRRNTIDLRGKEGMKHGMLHWTGNFDEVQDFDNQITALNGATGFAIDRKLKTHPQFKDSKANLHKDLDALAAYVASLDEYPKSPYKTTDGEMTIEAIKGRQHFIDLQCYTCHAGPTYTDSKLRHLHNVGTTGEFSGKRLTKKLTGFDTPTVISIANNPPYLHDGSAATLADVFTAGNGKEAEAHQRAQKLTDSEFQNLLAFLQQLDSEDEIKRADIGDSNKAPTFEQSEYTFDTTYGYHLRRQPIGTVSAADLDAGQTVHYQLAPSGSAGHFEIDAKTGHIEFLFMDHYFRHRFNRPYTSHKNYSFNVIAIDDCELPSYTETKVTVNVTYPPLQLEFKEFSEFWKLNKALDQGKTLNKAQATRLKEINELISSGVKRDLKFY